MPRRRTERRDNGSLRKKRTREKAQWGSPAASPMPKLGGKLLKRAESMCQVRGKGGSDAVRVSRGEDHHVLRGRGEDG